MLRLSLFLSLLFVTVWAADADTLPVSMDQCDGPVIRQAYRKLSTWQRDSLWKGFHLMKSTKTSISTDLPDVTDNIFDQFVRTHVNTQTYNQAHGTNVFLHWHRWLLARFEYEMRRLLTEENKKAGGALYDVCLGLPYWSWDEDYGNITGSAVWTSRDFGTLRVNQGEYCLFDGQAKGWTDYRGYCVSRDPVADSFGVGISAVAAMIADYPTFGGGFGYSVRGRAHVDPHNLVGGHMMTATSPADPIFWLHHCNLDRILAVWQDCHDHDLTPGSALSDTHAAYHWDNQADARVDSQIKFQISHNGINYMPRIMGSADVQAKITVRFTHNIANMGYRYGLDSVVSALEKLDAGSSKKTCSWTGWVNVKLKGDVGLVCCTSNCGPAETKECCADTDVYDKSKNACAPVPKICCKDTCTGNEDPTRCCSGYVKSGAKCIVPPPKKCCNVVKKICPRDSTKTCCSSKNYYFNGRCLPKTCCRTAPCPTGRLNYGSFCCKNFKKTANKKSCVPSTCCKGICAKALKCCPNYSTVYDKIMKRNVCKRKIIVALPKGKREEYILDDPDYADDLQTDAAIDLAFKRDNVDTVGNEADDKAVEKLDATHRSFLSILKDNELVELADWLATIPVDAALKWTEMGLTECEKSGPTVPVREAACKAFLVDCKGTNMKTLCERCRDTCRCKLRCGIMGGSWEDCAKKCTSSK